MTKIIFFLFIAIFISSCSIDKKSGIWSSQTIQDKNIKNKKILSELSVVLKEEYNSNIKIKLKENYSEYKRFDITNNSGISNYSGSIDEIYKYKFSKIDNFLVYNPELLFSQNGDVIFFDGKGTIFKLNNKFQVIWKNNFYSKKEKKLEPILNFSINDKKIAITDSLSNIYLIDLITGKLIWKKKESSAFNSQIKIHKNKLYSVDLNNTLKCLSLDTGKELWQYKSESTLIKSTNKISLVIFKNKIIFLNSVGDLNALDLDNGNLLWQSPLINSSVYEDTFSSIFSLLVLDENSIYVSNNKNEFFSINANTGVVKWRKKINSTLTPIIAEDLIFTVTLEGLLVLLNKKNGNLIRATKVINNIEKTKISGFLLTRNNIYISANSNLVRIENNSGQFTELKKISRSTISKPFIFDKHIFIVTDRFIKKYK